MKKLLLVSLLLASTQAMAFGDLINNTSSSVSVSVNGISGTLKPGAIVDFRPPQLKPPFRITATYQRGGKSKTCTAKTSDRNATIVIPGDCI